MNKMVGSAPNAPVTLPVIASYAHKVGLINQAQLGRLADGKVAIADLATARRLNNEVVKPQLEGNVIRADTKEGARGAIAAVLVSRIFDAAQKQGTVGLLAETARDLARQVGGSR